jgi:hypothetical protein
MALFRQKAARSPGEQRSNDVERLRNRWEEHTARVPPNPSPAPEYVEMRAAIAECDVKLSRYIGAVLTGHAQGLAAPFDVSGEYAEAVAKMTSAGQPRSEELKFFTEQAVEVSRILLEASRLQKTAP